MYGSITKCSVLKGPCPGAEARRTERALTPRGEAQVHEAQLRPLRCAPRQEARGASCFFSYPHWDFIIWTVPFLVTSSSFLALLCSYDSFPLFFFQCSLFFFFPLYPWDYYQLLCFWTPIGLLIVVIVNSSSYAPFFLLLTLLCFEPFSYLCFVPYMPSKLSFGDFDMWNVISYSIWNLRVAYGENFAYIRILIIY